MSYLELICGDKRYTKLSQIVEILKSNEFYWLLDSEVEDAIIEIRNNTIIWHMGNFYSGNWVYGIFKSGSFHGVFENGIFENGNFQGKWISGINLKKI